MATLSDLDLQDLPREWTGEAVRYPGLVPLLKMFSGSFSTSEALGPRYIVASSYPCSQRLTHLSAPSMVPILRRLRCHHLPSTDQLFRREARRRSASQSARRQLRLVEEYLFFQVACPNTDYIVLEQVCVMWSMFLQIRY